MPTNKDIVNLADYSIGIEIDELTEGKWFEGFAAGEFVEMWGREIEVKPEEMPTYLQNTLLAIGATVDESGAVVGLPIDACDHEGGEAAGWIVDVKMHESGQKLQFKPKWTEIGVELIKAGKMRFFSASFHLKKKVILGGTLTNWPATRDEKENILLQPISLSREKPSVLKGLYNFLKGVFGDGEDENPEKGDDTMGEEIKIEELDVVNLAKQDLEIEGDYASLSALVDAEADKRAAKMVAAQLALHKRREEIAQFVAGVTGGTEEHPVGLPVQSDKLTAFMETLNEEQRELAEEILLTIHESGLVSFDEIGHNDDISGKKELPEHVAKRLESGELKIEDLKDPMLALGDLSAYNLSKWTKEQ